MIASLKVVEVTNRRAFTEHIKHGKVESISYTMLSPYSLYLELDYKEGEFVMEFTGKVLKDRYPELINRDTIETCMENIESLGICKFDRVKLLGTAYICKLDVTVDTPYSNCSELTSYLKSHIRNYRKLLPRVVADNFIVEKNVKTNSSKKRMTFYDKGKELRRAENKEFLNQLKDPDRLLNYYDGKVRIELNLNSKEQIRRCLNVEDTGVWRIMFSHAEPIRDCLDEFFCDDVEVGFKANSLRELERCALLEKYHYDLNEIETQVRAVCSKYTHISSTMKPFRALAEKIKGDNSPNILKELGDIVQS